MVLYVQTPSIPRSGLHNVLIKTMIEYIDQLDQFNEIKWFVNLDAIKTSTTRKGGYQWENYNKTKDNFESIASKLNKTSLDLNISHDPCFYLAFRHLTLSVLTDIKQSGFKDSDYCVMWLEDDWSFIDKEKFNKNLTKFLNTPELKTYILYKNKINMGGNPDIIKGEVFNLFNNIDLSPTNKRDPENIRKHDVWYPNIFIDPWNEPLDTPPYNRLLRKLITLNDNYQHPGRNFQTKILSVNVVEGEQGDQWRANIQVNKNWNTNDKHGIDSSKTYSYQ